MNDTLCPCCYGDWCVQIWDISFNWLLLVRMRNCASFPQWLISISRVCIYECLIYCVCCNQLSWVWTPSKARDRCELKSETFVVCSLLVRWWHFMVSFTRFQTAVTMTTLWTTKEKRGASPMSGATGPPTCTFRVRWHYSCTVVPLNSCSVIHLYSCTVVLLYSCTVVQLYSCTVIRLYKFTVVPLYS